MAVKIREGNALAVAVGERKWRPQHRNPSRPAENPGSTRKKGNGVVDAPSSKVGLELSTHVHKSTSLAMHACRPRARIPHHTLHRRWIIELARHAHLHLQHRVEHVHTKGSKSRCTHIHTHAHTARPHLLGGKGKRTWIGHSKRMLWMVVLVG